MAIDSNNPIVKLCSKGIQAENAGRIEEAVDLYMEAWNNRTTDYESCIVAHYIARIQKDPDDILFWNQESLTYADKVHNDSVKSFYPSLYLNMGLAHEELGNIDEAKRYYELALGTVDIVDNDNYGTVVHNAIISALARLES